MRRHLCFVFTCVLLAATGRSNHGVTLYGTVKDYASGRPLFGSVVTLSDSTGTPVDRWETADNGKYEFRLALDEVYTIRYGGPHRTHKSIVIDTRHVDASEDEKKAGWAMNVDVTIFPRIEGLDRELAELPFGKASWDPVDTNFTWDMAHTMAVRERWVPVLALAGVAAQAMAVEGAGPVDIRSRRPPEWVREGVSSMVLWYFVLWALMGGAIRLMERSGRSCAPLLNGVLLVAMIGGTIGLQSVDADGWAMVLGPALRSAAVALFLVALVHGGPVLDKLLPDTPPVPLEERARSKNWFAWTTLVLVLLVFIVHLRFGGSADRVLDPGKSLVRAALYTLPMGSVLLAFSVGALRRWLEARADRVRFGVLLFVMAQVMLPVLVVLDRTMVSGIPDRRTAEIVDLEWHSGRPDAEVHQAVVLVDGVPKSLGIPGKAWDELALTDALEITIRRGPLGIDHIMEWLPVYRDGADTGSEEPDEEEVDVVPEDGQ